MSFDCDSLAVETVSAEAKPSRAVVAYGTETGNSKQLAYQLAEKAMQAGVSIDVVNLADYRLRQLQREHLVIFICSTHGDGDAPEPIGEFYSALMNEQKVELGHLRFAMLALGDTSYPLFCGAGKNIEERLIQLGAEAVLPRLDCDVDYQDSANQWMEDVIKLLPATTTDHTKLQRTATLTSTNKPVTEYSKANPCVAEVIENIRLTGAESEKVIHHLEIALPEGDLGLNAGDAIGILAHNSAVLIDTIVDLLGANNTEEVVINQTKISLIEALQVHVDLVIPGKKFLTTWAKWSQHPDIQKVASADFAEQRRFLREHQVVDVMQNYPAQPHAQAFVDMLRPLQPRIYDLANHSEDGDLHILVKEYRYEFREREERGVASTWLTALSAGSSIKIYPHVNKKFHLPKDQSAPLIFIGYETGVAPYRAFLQAIKTEGRQHRCWMIIDMDAVTGEVIYQLDWLAARHDGRLIHIDPVTDAEDSPVPLAAWLTGKSSHVMEWLLMGAHLYVCGDRSVLQSCEAALEQLCSAYSQQEKLPESLSWANLIKQERIHLNLY